MPGLPDRASAVVHVPPGKVDEISASLLGEISGGTPLVALGGGRVVDTAKALAGATGARCAAIPTTLSGAEMTPFHRLPAGVDGARMVRPALVIADPDLMASAPPTRLAASAMNALAHAMEALYTPLRSPVTDLAALRAAALLAGGIVREPPGRADLALGAAAGRLGLGLHRHRVPPRALPDGRAHRGLAPRRDERGDPAALRPPHGGPGARPDERAGRARSATAAGDPEAAAGDIARIAARCGHTRLATLGVTEEHLPAAASAAASHPALALTPDPPGETELLELLRAAL